MKNFSTHKNEIFKRIKSSDNFLLLLDFDGVLSDIAETPAAAFLSEKNRRLLRECANHFPVILISGRALRDLKQKVRLPKLLYAANHGLEWSVDGTRHVKPVPRKMLSALARAKKELQPIFSHYPGTFLEDKRVNLAIHYRKLARNRVHAFIKEVSSVLKSIAAQNNLRLDHDNKTFELRTGTLWNKGHIVKLILDHFQRKTPARLFPVYIGDAVTDEDAFKTLRSGITLRVGKSSKSAAQYYFPHRADVDKFLSELLAFCR